jgi:N-acetylglucosaminyldiphosphoundecaprenol N-acetyl-beta-D-mannosaminyltransferase
MITDVNNHLPIINLCGVRFTPVTVEALHGYIASQITARQRAPIFHVNVHAINLAQRDSEFRQILNAASLVFCDGFGVRLGARLMGHKTSPRITYADWMYQLSPFCAEHGFSLYLLGSEPGVALLAAQRLQERYPRLKIAGTHHGYFEKSGADNQRVIDAINHAKPNIVIVGLGMPLQEKWIARHIEQLQTHVVLSGGACLDYIAGTLRRGSPLLVNHGFEWLARLLIEPRRLWRRYLLGNPYFFSLLARQYLREKMLGK